MKQNRALTTVLAIAATAGLALAQAPKKAPASPPMETTATIGGKAVTIKYSAPSVNGRKIFGGSDALQPDNSVWRAGANNATALHTDGDIKIGNLDVPAGDYTLYVVLDPKAWQLVVSKQTGQWGINRDGSTTLDESKALGRVPMKMSKPDSLVERYMINLAGGGNKGTLTLQWENKKATVDISAK
ncbi:MAG: hypothetical protein JWP63_3450 [Candidatus Solibacter sp.]|jgi:hypothetical protein|nr:hypothetical protein [Candidatus Solibacter sp.]